MQKYLLVGLGNIGEKYAETRHNIGFKVVENWAARKEVQFETCSFGVMAKTKHRGRQVFVLKPDTYMNLSGKAVRYWIEKEKIQMTNIMVITDDLNLPFRKIRIRGKGSGGGHNGLKSVESELNTTQYPRMRMGVGKDFQPGEQIDYVLGRWTGEEQNHLREFIQRATDALETFVFNGIHDAMNQFN